ncbi:MAG: TusE/DsrC/DsvC family sulfur relay protein [Gammaproteobacteria bacterium]|nr:TusE/DsrC/DsvC family sulfur relay protein [Gammaproteobacteria bacterium]
MYTFIRSIQKNITKLMPLSVKTDSKSPKRTLLPKIASAAGRIPTRFYQIRPHILSGVNLFKPVKKADVQQEAETTTSKPAGTQSTSNAHDSEPSRSDRISRGENMKNQEWKRSDASALASEEGLEMNDGHWAVIQYLRKLYIKSGTPRHARILARKLNRKFASKGGSQYLHRLFRGGPVTQGSRLANLRVPDDATDSSFGTRF